MKNTPPDPAAAVAPAAPAPAGTVRAVLVVHPALANLVTMALRHGSYSTDVITTERAMRDALAAAPPHLVFVDVDRFDAFLDLVVTAIPAVPVLAFTRRRDTARKLAAFERGADDIIEVPFTLDEIVVRPYALLRRASGVSSRIVPRLRIGDHLEVDLLAQTVTLEGERRLELTPIQQSLLYLLAANAGDVLTRETILETIWGGDFQIESNVVDRHIRELRVKLGDDWRTPKYIETIPGRGYRFRRREAAGDIARRAM